MRDSDTFEASVLRTLRRTRRRIGGSPEAPERVFNDEEDRALMQRIAKSDAQAFEALYLSYEKAIAHFLFRMCYDEAAAEDGLQEVFMRVWRSAGRWRGDGKVSTFLFQIAKNVGLDARSKTAREKARFSSGGDDDDSTAQHEPVDDGPGPVQDLEGQELRDAVLGAVDSLPDDQRMVVQLAQTEGLTYREVAEILELPLGTVKSRMAAAAENLRWKLKRHVK